MSRVTSPSVTVRSQLFWEIVVLLFAAALVALYLPPDFGVVDFLEYWASDKVALRGQSPYSPEILLAEEIKIRPGMSQALMMWNPPWLLLLLRPILSFDFDTGRRLFFVVNVLIYFLCARGLVIALDTPRTQQFKLILCAFIFVPFATTLRGGQVSILLLAGEVLLLLSVVRRYSAWYFALALLFLSIKPQLFVAVLTIVAFDLFRTRSWAPVVIAVSLMIGVMGVTELCYPSVVQSWVRALFLSHSEVTPVLQWVPVSVVAPITSVLAPFSAGALSLRELVLIVWLVPLCAVVLGCGWYLLLNKKRVGLPLLIGLQWCSCFVAPHIWLADYVVLLPLFLWPLYVATSQSGGLRWWVSPLLIGLGIGYQLLFFAATKIGPQVAEVFFWYSLPMVGVALLTWRLKMGSKSPGHTEFSAPIS